MLETHLDIARHKLAIWLTVMALVTSAFVIFTNNGRASADANTDLMDAQRLLRQCQLDLQFATTSAERTRAQQCITIKQKVIAGLTATPSPSPSTTTTSSPSPSPTVTVPPTTTPPTTTPPPTTTSPPPANINCLAAPSTCGFPDATNTGASGTLTVVQGDVTIGVAGATYSNKDVRGCINVRAANVTISNVKVTCGSNPDGTPRNTIDYYGQGGGRLTVQDTTIVCTNDTDTGIGDNHFTAIRINVSGCENGFAAYNQDPNTQAYIGEFVTIQDSWCHNLTSEAGAEQHHTDCFEGNMISGTIVQHNTLTPGHDTTSAIGGGCGLCGTTMRTGWQILNNLLDGGSGGAIYCLRTVYQTGSQIIGNRFGTDQRYGPSPSDSCNDPRVEWHDNVLDATNAPLAAA